MEIPLSVVILAKDEEEQIEECIKSAHGWAGEIIVIDDESRDRTAEIASRYNVKVFSRRMDLEGRQRNFGIDKAKFDWVYMLDCDERLTPQLKEEITEALSRNEENVIGYMVPKIHYLGKRRLDHGGWSRPSIKIGNRKYVRVSEAEHDLVHPGVIAKPGYIMKELKSPYIHLSFKNIEDFIRKDNRYSTLEAVKWHMDGRKMTFSRALWRTWDRFMRRFVSKKGYKDGFYGFVAAFISGFHEFSTYAKYREIKENNTYICPHKSSGDTRVNF